jgi:hypothetical protein
MKVYLAGPMSGLPQFNYPAFDAMAALLRQQVTEPGVHGIEVVSPAEQDSAELRARVMLSPDGDIRALNLPQTSWGDFLSKAVKLVADGGFDAIVVLAGWERSRGARLETFVGHLCGIKIMQVCTYYSGNVGFWEIPRSTLLRAWEGGINA